VLSSIYVGMGIKLVQLPLSGLLTVVDSAGRTGWTGCQLVSHSLATECCTTQKQLIIHVPSGIRNYDRSIEEQETVHF